jgi:hypothetical protein
VAPGGKDGGKAQRGIRRALVAHGGEATTRQIWEWTHPSEVNCRDRRRRQNISRVIGRAADKIAVRAGKRWRDGIVWRLRPPD